MKVVLLQDIPTLGLSGEIKNVANGYGRNYLLPNKFAALATDTIVKQTEVKRQEAAIRRQRIEEDQKQLAQRIENVTVEIKAKAGLENQLYGSVTNVDIASALSEVIDTKIDRKKVVLPKSIRQLGNYDVNIKFSPTISARIKVIVRSEDEGATEATQPEAKVEATTVDTSVESSSVEEVKGEEAKDVPGEATAS